jgi:CHAT domain-containing protein
MALTDSAAVLLLATDVVLENNAALDWHQGRVLGLPSLWKGNDVLQSAALYLAGSRRRSADGQAPTAPFRAADVLNLPLTHNKLTALTRLDAAEANQPNTDALATLTAAFRAAGAKSLLIRLWKGDEAAETLFLQAYYKHLLQSGDAAAACRAAQEEIRMNPQYAHPFYWGNYITIAR